MKSSKVPNRTDSCKFPKRRPNVRQAKLRKSKSYQHGRHQNKTRKKLLRPQATTTCTRKTKRATIKTMNLSNEGRTFEQYLAKTSMEEIQELLRN